MSLTARLDVPLAEISVGCAVWALDLNAQTDADAQQVKGGTVVEIVTNVDDETGEVERRFVTATVWRGAIRFDHVNAGDVRQSALPNTAAIRGLIRKAGEVVAGAKGRVSSETARCIALQSRLMEVL